MHELNSKEILFNDYSECKLEKQDIAATNKQIIHSFDYQTKFFFNFSQNRQKQG